MKLEISFYWQEINLCQKCILNNLVLLTVLKVHLPKKKKYCKVYAARQYRFYLQKTSQEKFRIEKVLKRKGDKLHVKWKGYDNSFNSWIDK